MFRSDRRRRHECRKRPADGDRRPGRRQNSYLPRRPRSQRRIPITREAASTRHPSAGCRRAQAWAAADGCPSASSGYASPGSLHLHQDGFGLSRRHGRPLAVAIPSARANMPSFHDRPVSPHPGTIRPISETRPRTGGRSPPCSRDLHSRTPVRSRRWRRFRRPPSSSSQRPPTPPWRW